MLDGPRLAPLSGSRPDALIILIHGYGSNGEDLISLAAMMQPSLPQAAFVAPNAPLQIPHMTAAHQWWSIETFSMAERAAGAAAAAPTFDAFIDAELEKAALASDRLLLVGFSQGTMMALHVGLRRPHPVAGIIGMLPGVRSSDSLSLPNREAERQRGEMALAMHWLLPQPPM